MDVRAFDDPALFAEVSAAFVEADPFTTSVIASQVDSVLSGMRPPGPGHRYWTVADGERTVGIAMHGPPRSLFVAGMPPEAASALAGCLAATGRSLSGVNGESRAVAAFSASWARRSGAVPSRVVSLRMYRMADLVPPRVPGRGRLADSRDLDVVAAWLDSFHAEARPEPADPDRRTLAAERISAGQVHLWEDHDTVVSMSAATSAVAGVSRVGPVFTPGPHRRRGYGAAVTALATAAALDHGAEHVVLYADLSNSTSNAIYRAIGYRPHHDAEERFFSPHHGVGLPPAAPPAPAPT